MTLIPQKNILEVHENFVWRPLFLSVLVLASPQQTLVTRHVTRTVGAKRSCWDFNHRFTLEWDGKWRTPVMCVWESLCECMDVWEYVYGSVCVWIYVSACIWVCVCECEWVHMSVCMSMWACVYTSANDWTQSFIHAKQVLHHWATSPTWQIHLFLLLLLWLLLTWGYTSATQGLFLVWCPGGFLLGTWGTSPVAGNCTGALACKACVLLC